MYFCRLSNQYFNLRRPKSERMADTEWTFFPGDLVQVMVGKDKGRQGLVLTTSRDSSDVRIVSCYPKSLFFVIGDR